MCIFKTYLNISIPYSVHSWGRYTISWLVEKHRSVEICNVKYPCPKRLFIKYSFKWVRGPPKTNKNNALQSSKQIPPLFKSIGARHGPTLQTKQTCINHLAAWFITFKSITFTAVSATFQPFICELFSKISIKTKCLECPWLWIHDNEE